MLSVEMCEAESWFTRSWLIRLVFCFINKAKVLTGLPVFPKMSEMSFTCNPFLMKRARTVHLHYNQDHAHIQAVPEFCGLLFIAPHTSKPGQGKTPLKMKCLTTAEGEDPTLVSQLGVTPSSGY